MTIRDFRWPEITSDHQYWPWNYQTSTGLAGLKRDFEMGQQCKCLDHAVILVACERTFFSTVAFAWLLMCSMHVLCRNSGRIISTTHARDITHIVMAFCQTNAQFFWMSKLFRFLTKDFSVFVTLRFSEELMESLCKF